MDPSKFYQTTTPLLLSIPSSLSNAKTSASNSLVSNIIMALTDFSGMLFFSPWMVLFDIVLVIGLVLYQVFKTVNRAGLVYDEQLRMVEEGLLDMEEVDRRFSDGD